MKNIQVILIKSLLTGLLLITSLQASPTQCNRTIIFGDSLSDTGNFPEPANFFPVAQKPVPYNLYVPISEPVNSQFYASKFVVPNIKESITWSYPSYYFLTNSSSAQGLIKDNKKAFRSINWPQYFIFNHYDTDSRKLRPWVDVINPNKTKPSKCTSINYAWSWALSENQFADTNYQKKSKTFSIDEIFALQKAYRIDNSKNINTIPIPGLLAQVNLYLDELQKQTIYENQNTNYILYIGANDIGNAFYNQLLKLDFDGFRKTIGDISKPGTIAKNVQQSVDTLIENASAKHIYVVTLYNLAKAPKTRNTLDNLPKFLKPVQDMVDNIVKNTTENYNNQLKAIFSNERYRDTVHIIDLGNDLNQLTKQATYYRGTKQGLDCQSNKPSAFQPKPDLNLCRYDNNQAYFFWNDSHFTTLVNQFVAYKIHQAIMRHTKPTLTKVVPRSDTNFSKLIDEIKLFFKSRHFKLNTTYKTGFPHSFLCQGCG